MNNKNKAILQMIICATLWSSAGILMKWIPWSGFTIASFRSLIAGITITLFILIDRIPFVINKRTLISGALTGLVYICFTSANKLTTSANAIVLQFTSPVFILIFSYLFYNTSFKKIDIITVILTLIGISLCFCDQLESGYVFGNIVSILAGMFMAIMFILVGNLQENEKFSAICIGQFFTFFACLPNALLSKPVFDFKPVICIFALGIFQLGISYILYIKSSKYCPPLACCLIGGLEPLLNPIWVLLFYGEKPGVFALIGGIIVVITVTVWCVIGNVNESKSA